MPRKPSINFVKTPEHLSAEQAGQQRAAEHKARLAKPETQAAIAASRIAPPPWETEDWTPPLPPDDPGERLKKMKDRLAPSGGLKLHNLQVTPIREKLPSMVKLKAARKKLLELADVVRDEAFDYWLGQHVVAAERPDEWTRSRPLYENYLKHAKEYGNNRADKKLAKTELASETRFGRMMGSRFPDKQRRPSGWFYPLRLKRGA